MKRILSATAALFCAMPLLAQEAETAVQSSGQSPAKAAAIAFAAALTMAFSVLGAGAAVGKIGSAALGAAAEKPEILSKSIIFVALAEGLSVLGFVIAIMLVSKII